MVIGNPDAVAAAAANGTAGGVAGANSLAHPSGIPQDKIDNIMSGIANTGDVKMNNHRKKLRQRFDIIKKLGQGTYGKVQLGINKETGQEVAIKTIKKCKIEAEADLVRIRREVQIMSSVQHPNIIHIYEVFENREKMVLVMEFAAGGELYDYLSERKVLSEEEARRIFRQVATAVYYCHKHKICHRDLKLENILLDEQGNAKIADFGLSNVFDDQRVLSTFCGSPLYASPEIVEGTPYHGPEVDCWSLGVLLYTLVYGSMPFDGSNFKRLVKQISQGDYYEPKKPSRASSLIRDMLTVCPRKRATIEQICSHWWVNENDNISCLDLAENLANQTPVRLDVLLSLTPAAITADQLVVPSADGTAAGKAGERVPRSHSVGSIRDIGGATEAERRILDMVAAGGEAALMPSPTRTITPAQSPIQSKRKLQTTVSTENAAGSTVKKKEKPGSSPLLINEGAPTLNEETPMEVEDALMEEPTTAAAATTTAPVKITPSGTFSQKDMEKVGDLCQQLIQDTAVPAAATTESTKAAESGVAATAAVPRQKTAGKLDAVEETAEEKDATKVIKKFVNKHKTADLVNAIGQITPEKTSNESAPTTTNTIATTTPSKKAATTTSSAAPPPFVRKCSLQDESQLNKFNADRRKSRILETAEKFQQMNAGNGADKPKKFVIPGVSVGSFKKEFERKATTTPATAGPTAGALRALEQVAAAAAAAQELESAPTPPSPSDEPNTGTATIEGSDSKNSVTSLSLDDARRSMENSIALLRQAQNESSKEVDQLCAKTENFGVSDTTPTTDFKVAAERERKLKNARAIIGNAIQPASPGGDPNAGAGTVKTSTASITLKSATLPRRKAAKTEIQLDIKPRIVEQPAMRFTTEMQHPVADLRSAPPREGPIPYSPIKAPVSARATSLEPKEHIIPIQKPQAAYARTTSNTTTRSGGSLSRQSTVDSESDTNTTTTNMSQSTLTGSSQPIKKSPREFIIPIAMEGGGFITPREGSIEPSESSHTAASSRTTFSRIRPTRRIGSLLSDAGVEEGLPFQKMRTSSNNRDGDDDARFTLHRLRSSRPVKKISQDNDSQSSGEEDDDDGFEILTAENLFSTLLQRVRALTNRLNVNNDLTAGFPNSSRLLSNMRQSQSPFWNQEPFGSRLNNAGHSVNAPWRHSMSRDLGSDMESMFSRSGATLPRGNKTTKAQNRATLAGAEGGLPADHTDGQRLMEEPLDLADLDLSRLRLSKKDLETLSSIAPGLPKCFQEQLLAKLPPTQARKLSRTLSMQNSPLVTTVKVYKRSQSGGRPGMYEAATLAVPPPNDLKEHVAEEAAEGGGSSKTSDDSSERTLRSSLYLRSLSRSRQDCEATPTAAATAVDPTTLKSRSVCRDDCSKSLCSSAAYASEVNDKYKYYSPYLSKSAKESSSAESGSVSPQKRYGGSVSLRDTSTATLGRPPSGCLSPSPTLALVPVPVQAALDSGSNSLRGRTAQRPRISRFLRPDFFDEQSLGESPYQREKRLRERETQSVLREIREKSREPSRERLSGHDDEPPQRKHSLPSDGLEQEQQKFICGHVRNKSMDTYASGGQDRAGAQQEINQRHRRSLSRPRDLGEEMDKHALADKILQELQLLSAVRSQQEHRMSVPRELSVERSAEIITQTLPRSVELVTALVAAEEPIKEHTGTIKKVKKVKPKEKIAELDADSKTTTTTTTTVVRKVKKIVKKTELAQTPTSEGVTELCSQLPTSTADANQICNSNDAVAAGDATKKESKLKRPKSYPTKEATPTPVSAKAELPSTKLPTKQPPTIPEANAELISDSSQLPTLVNCSASIGGGAPRESRLVRPKSYPASKLTVPKDAKKTTRSGIAIANIAETSQQPASCEDKPPASTTMQPKGSIDSSSSSDSRPTTLKKIVKVTKKSKLVQPTPITPTTPTAAANTSTADEDSKESSPTVREQLKEKSPEKKHSKGLLYAIGQKFEKLRDSAMHKEKKAAAMVANATTASNSTKKSSPENSSPEKIKEKTLLKKKSSNKTDKPTLATSFEVTPKTAKAAAAAGSAEKPVAKDKRSRIDAMIRSLRERSVPRTSTAASESNYIKRAVSVEQMPGTFNKNAVNKVLGLFKRFEKDGSERRVRNTRSTSNIERQLRESSPSPIYQNAAAAEGAAKKAAAVSCINERSRTPPQCSCELQPPPLHKSSQPPLSCAECVQHQTATMAMAKRRDEPPHAASAAQPVENGQGNKDKRKGLMLDLSKMEHAGRNAKAAYVNGNGIYSNLPPYPGAVNNSSNNSSSQQSVDNAANNNNNNSCVTNNNNSSSMHTSQTSGYRTLSAHEINRNHLLTPSTENIANYSSDSRSYQDDCASTSTFLSPTDEPELCFDNWSICSEDNYRLHATPSPTVSRLSRASQLSSPTRGGGESSDPNESVIDRIKRRSFYCRFNEKKPKRTSSIVGPSAVRDYYREQQAAVKARSNNKLSHTSERGSSPDITHEFFRPLKLSPIGNELKKPPVYRSPHDYVSATVGNKSRKSLSDIRPSTSTSPSFLSKRFGSTAAADSDYLSLSATVPTRFKTSSSSSPYESNGTIGHSSAIGHGGYYSTYNPKRRSSYTLNGTLPSGTGATHHMGSSNIDGYATMGRRSIRPYDHRTISLLDPALTASTASYHRDALTPVRDYTSSISRSSSRYRSSPTSRSPTNI